MSGLDKFIAGVVLGAAAGAAVAIFLQTDKGKKVMSDVKDAAADVSEKIKSKLKEFGDEVNDYMDDESDVSASV
jgi:gas vesicle protein